MNRKIMLTIIAICVIIIFTGCKNGNLKVDTDAGVDNISSNSGEFIMVDSDSGESSEKNNELLEEEVYKYNESGKIIIVMYHRFADVETDEYSRSFDNFRKDLEYLYELDYRTVSLNDYLENNMKVPVRLHSYYFYV